MTKTMHQTKRDSNIQAGQTVEKEHSTQKHMPSI